MIGVPGQNFTDMASGVEVTVVSAERGHALIDINFCNGVPTTPCTFEPEGVPCSPAGSQSSSRVGVGVGDGVVHACSKGVCRGFNHTKCGRVIEVVAEVNEGDGGTAGNLKDAGFPRALLGTYLRNDSRLVSGRVVYGRLNFSYCVPFFQNGSQAKSGFEMCFGPSTPAPWVLWPKHVSNLE